MPQTLAQLVAAQTNDQMRAALLAALQGASPPFPVTSWEPGSVPRTLMEIDAAELADLTVLIAAIARGGYVTGAPGVTGASGDWLDLAGQNRYGLTRNPALATVGIVTLVDAAGAGPFNISPGQIWVGATATMSTPTPLRFLNTTGGVLPKGGALTIPVAAEAPGSVYNVANGAITTMLTNLPGVTVSNSPGSGTWITSQGTDAESDLAYSTRCMGRWPSIGVGATAATIDSWCRTASAEVTKTKVQPNGTTAGQIDVWLAGTAGPVSGSAVSAVQAYLTPRIPISTTHNVSNSTALAVVITATINAFAASLQAAQAAVAAKLQTLIASTGIGGVLYLSQVIEALNAPPGVRNSSGALINGSASDLVLSAAQVATYGAPVLTWNAI